MEDNQTISITWYSRIKRLLRPPVFEDEEKNRIAVILGVILWSVVAVVGILVITWLITGKSHELGQYAIAANTFIIVVAIGLLYLIRKSYVNSAGFIFVAFIWANITFQAFTSDGVRGSAAIIYMTIMVLASLLLGWRASIGIAALSTLAIWILAHSEQAGLMYFQLDGPYEVALESTGVFVLAAVFLSLTTTGLSNALKRARESEISLKESNRALQYNLEQLEQRENALRDSEERFRLLAENVVDVIWILDPDTLLFVYISPSVERIAGYRPDEVMGMKLDQLLTDASKELKDQFLKDELAINQPDASKTTRIELNILHKNGTTVWVETIARVLYINWLSAFGIIGVTRDITERKESEEERKKLHDQLLQAQKMEAVGTLAGGIAHDFNNSLQGILGYAQILIFDKNKEDPDLKLLKQIEKAAKWSSELTKQLLTFSRKMESQLRPLDLNQEVRQLEQLLERTIPKMIGIDTRLGNDLKIINGDPIQIEQVIINLSINARDAMPDGGKLVFECENTILDDNYCKMHVDVSPGEFVRLSISDTGIGMNKQTQEHIFEPFFTTKGTGQGTGLGLAMVYGIVKNHRGHITCESRPGKGTSFRVYFPVIEEGGRQLLKQHSEMVQTQHGNETILLVDDEDYLRNLGKLMLTKFGYNVLTAPDGETALQIYREQAPHISLVILDLIMPGIGGNNCLDLILKHDPAARVIIASGYSVDGPTKKELESKTKGFISKPFELNQIISIVRKTLDDKIPPDPDNPELNSDD
jgi:two-component system cell cycle sensor histidine kinase/response regulator CckA